MDKAIPIVPAASILSKWQDETSAAIRFAGDSGDGIQLIGGQFVRAGAAAGNDYATFPDFPAEIRAPVGTTYGVSAFQVHFGERRIYTIGDSLDVLVCFNPAALKTNIGDVIKGGMLIIDESAFTERNLRKAGYQSNPLSDGSLDEYNVTTLNITAMASESVSGYGLGNKEAGRSKNMWALGLSLWVFKRDMDTIIAWLEQKFADSRHLAEANIAALRAGYSFGDIGELSLPENRSTRGFGRVDFAPGRYRNITGTQALALGLVAAGVKSQVDILFASYPITPASALLHEMTRFSEHGIRTFQAEDEIASVSAAIGASYSGHLGVSSSSGPGVALKGEAIGLAYMAELPLLIINTQRGGPSTGLPTKTEQSDLWQAIVGRNADSFIPVIAADSPSDCFETAFLAVRLALEYMTPVFLLSDGFLANSSEVWRLPDLTQLVKIKPPYAPQSQAGDYHPYRRNEKTQARFWAVPGRSGFMHRIGGLEKADVSGEVSYDPDNHQKMTELRAAKLAKIAEILPPQEVALGNSTGRLAVIGWGSTFGPIHRAVDNLQRRGARVSHIHLRHLSPLPLNLGELLAGFDELLVVEMNMGQLQMLLQGHLVRSIEGLHSVTGRPIKVSQIETRIRSILDKGHSDE